MNDRVFCCVVTAIGKGGESAVRLRLMFPAKKNSEQKRIFGADPGYNESQVASLVNIDLLRLWALFPSKYHAAQGGTMPDDIQEFFNKDLLLQVKNLNALLQGTTPCCPSDICPPDDDMAGRYDSSVQVTTEHVLPVFFKSYHDASNAIGFNIGASFLQMAVFLGNLEAVHYFLGLPGADADAKKDDVNSEVALNKYGIALQLILIPLMHAYAKYLGSGLIFPEHRATRESPLAMICLLLHSGAEGPDEDAEVFSGPVLGNVLKNREKAIDKFVLDGDFIAVKDLLFFYKLRNEMTHAANMDVEYQGASHPLLFWAVVRAQIYCSIGSRQDEKKQNSLDIVNLLASNLPEESIRGIVSDHLLEAHGWPASARVTSYDELDGEVLSALRPVVPDHGSDSDSDSESEKSSQLTASGGGQFKLG